MNCEQVMKEEIIEKYLLGRLGEADEEAFEQHYFECPRCFEELETYRALQAELRRAGPATRAEYFERRPSWRWLWAAGLAAALVTVGIAFWLRRSAPQSVPPAPAAMTLPRAMPPTPSRSPGPFLTELARFEPPPYTPLTLRGVTDEATERFHEAMAHYLKKDYTAAIRGLRAAARLDPKAANTQFFLATSYLLTDKTDAAIQGFQRTIALGNSPYFEEAHFYLAKAYLGKGDVGAAQDRLKKTVQLRGDLAEQAQGLLNQLQALGQEPR
jgi:tetratricopeptide (TPR) repeat protein